MAISFDDGPDMERAHIAGLKQMPKGAMSIEGFKGNHGPRDAPTALGRELEITAKVTQNLTEAIGTLAALVQPFLDPAEPPAPGPEAKAGPEPPVSPMADQARRHRRDLEALVRIVNDLCARIER